ncbi:Endo-1,4-beta-xylanase B [Fusarium oxysporum f. sp. albedinis]|nr:Endo-1,4-beta-xylanase B [Fusarium oxysporum f. sp. albedinis]
MLRVHAEFTATSQRHHSEFTAEFTWLKRSQAAENSLIGSPSPALFCCLIPNLLASHTRHVSYAMHGAVLHCDVKMENVG